MTHEAINKILENENTNDLIAALQPYLGNENEEEVRDFVIELLGNQDFLKRQDVKEILIQMGNENDAVTLIMLDVGGLRIPYFNKNPNINDKEWLDPQKVICDNLDMPLLIKWSERSGQFEKAILI